MTDLENIESYYNKIKFKYQKHVFEDMNIICLVYFDDSTQSENRTNRAIIFNNDGSRKSDFAVGFTGERKYTLDELRYDINEAEKAIEWRKKTYGR